MKISRHALTVLTRQYRSVLLKCALINAGLFLAVAPAMAADTWTGAITATDNFMDTLEAGGWDRGVDPVTGWGVDQILGIMGDAATKTDAAVAAVGDSSGGLVKDVADLKTTVGDATSGLVQTVGTINSSIATINGNITNINSTLTNDYYTKTQVDNAISGNNTTLLGDANVTGSIAETLGGTGSQTLKQVIQGLAGTDIKVENIDATNYSGSDLETKVAGQISTALANGTDPYQTASDVASAITTATTGMLTEADFDTGTTNGTIKVGTKEVAVAGLGTAAYKADTDFATAAQGTKADNAISYIGSQTTAYDTGTALAGKTVGTGSATDITVANALGALNTAAKTNSDDIATLQTNVTTLQGDVSSLEALVGTDPTAGTGILAGKTITGTTGTNNLNVIDALNTVASGAASLNDSNVFKGATNTFGATGGSQVTITNGGSMSVDHNLTIGKANAISSTETGYLDMGGNNLSNVKGLTLTDGTGHTNDATISVDVNGIHTSNKTFDVGTGSLKSETLYVGDTDQFKVDGSGNIETSGSATVGTLDIGSTGKGFDASGNLTAGTISATGIDTTGTNTVKLGGTSFTTAVTGDMTVSGNTTLGGTLSAGATTISATGTTAGTPVSALAVTAENTTDSKSTSFSVTSDGVNVLGDTKLTGDLILSDGTNNFTLGAAEVDVDFLDGTSATDAPMLAVEDDLFVEGRLSTAEGLSVFKYNTSTGRNEEQFDVNTNGDITTLGTLSVADGDFTVDGDGAVSAAGGNFTVDKNGAVATASTLTADGESKLGKIGSTTTYALDVVSGADAAHSTVTANAVIEATQGVRFGVASGTDPETNPVMTSVNHGTAIAAMDTADTTTTTGNDVVASAQAVAKTRDAINAELNAQLGDIFTVNADRSLTYKDAALAGNGFETGATTLADELTKYAENVVNATGVSFAADGTPTTAYVVKTATDTADYSNVTAGTSLKAAIDKLDQNIGLAMTPTGSTRTTTSFRTAATNTVNQNLSALDAAIGADVTGVDRSASLAGASTAAANSVNANINALDVALGNLTYTGGTINYTNGTGSVTTAIQTINANIGAATTAAKGNIASGNSVNANLDSLDAAIGDRSFATTHYIAPNDDLATAATKLDTKLNSLDHDVRKLHHEMNRGLASVAALSALIPNARGTGNTTLSVGTGYYNGQSSMAFGGAHWFTDNLMVNVGAAASVGHTRDMTYRAGVSYSF